ncbi:unnamed protein product [Effrenium voratum]|nr:unnamed protein product [Effrenium voratum]
MFESYRQTRLCLRSTSSMLSGCIAAKIWWRSSAASGGPWSSARRPSRTRAEFTTEALERLERAGGYPRLGAFSGAFRQVDGKDYKYLNSGCLVGYAGALSRATARILAGGWENPYVLRSRLAVNEEERRNMLMGSDDQIAWHTYALNHPEEIALDYRAQLFLSVLGVALKEFQLKESREVVAMPFGGHSTCFAHGNGASNMAIYVAQIQQLAALFPGIQPGNCSEGMKDIGNAKVWQLDCEDAIRLTLSHLAMSPACAIISLAHLSHCHGMAKQEADMAVLVAACLVLPIAVVRLPRCDCWRCWLRASVPGLRPGQQWLLQVPAECSAPVWLPPRSLLTLRKLKIANEQRAVRREQREGESFLVASPPEAESQVLEDGGHTVFTAWLRASFGADTKNMLGSDIRLSRKPLEKSRPRLEFQALDYVAKVGPLEPPLAVLFGPGLHNEGSAPDPDILDCAYADEERVLHLSINVPMSNSATTWSGSAATSRYKWQSPGQPMPSPKAPCKSCSVRGMARSWCWLSPWHLCRLPAASPRTQASQVMSGKPY